MIDSKVRDAINALPKTLYTEEGLKIIGVREVITVLRYIEPGSFKLDDSEDIEFTPSPDTPDDAPDFENQEPVLVTRNKEPQKVFVDENNKDHIESDLYEQVAGDARFLVSDDWSQSFEKDKNYALRFVYDLEKAEIAVLQVSTMTIERSETGASYDGGYVPASRSQMAQFMVFFGDEMASDLVEAIKDQNLQVTNVMPGWAREMVPSPTKAQKTAPAV